MTTPPAPHQESGGRLPRAERLLDVAADLLLRWGYRRITMDDIAAQAGIGKGTIYLHWKTREDLFRAVLHREAAATFADVLATIRHVPEAALLPNLSQALFLAVMRRPLMRATFVADAAVLGKLARGSDPLLDAKQEQAFHAYLHVLLDHGLLRAELTPEELSYAYDATIIGFYMAERTTDTASLSLERRAALLATTIQHAFGVAAPRQEDLQAAHAQVIAIFTALIDLYQNRWRGGSSDHSL
jgi:AcrR family transcriptional regulator